MAFIGKNDNRTSAGKDPGATIISSGTKIVGDIEITSSLHVDGEIEGKLKSSNVITIGTKGQVKGELVAKSLVINGSFEGSIESDVVEILSKGKVKGTMLYNELTIEKGGDFEGESKRRSPPANSSNVTELLTEQSSSDTVKNKSV